MTTTGDLDLDLDRDRPSRITSGGCSGKPDDGWMMSGGPTGVITWPGGGGRYIGCSIIIGGRTCDGGMLMTVVLGCWGLP